MTAHGTWTRYESGCRCDDCTAYNRARQARQRAAKRTVELVELRLEVSCLACGGAVRLVASGVPTDGGTETRSTVKCERNGCRREWIVGAYQWPAIEAQPELELPAAVR